MHHISSFDFRGYIARTPVRQDEASPFLYFVQIYVLNLPYINKGSYYSELGFTVNPEARWKYGDEGADVFHITVLCRYYKLLKEKSIQI